MRLIDADALNAELESYVFSSRTDGATVRQVKRIAEAIANAPTVDPVKHGRWETEIVYVQMGIMMGEREHYKCSECRFMVIPKTNFCSRCGAKMDEEVSE